MPEQHIGPGQGESPGTLTPCRAPSNVGLWSGGAHTYLLNITKKTALGFFPIFGNRVVTVGTTGGHVQEVGSGDVRRGRCGAAA